MAERKSRIIYKIATRVMWAEALEAGHFTGSADDARDGFIHFSTAEQLAETARKHFSGQSDLVLIAVDSDRLGMALVWEASRNGASFPHLYAPLPIDAALWSRSLPTGPDGTPDVTRAIENEGR